MPGKKLPKWTTTASKYLVVEKRLKLRADTCVTPAGHTIDPYFVLEFVDWVNCFVIDANGDVVVVRQYRHGAGEYVLELVAGTVDASDSSPLECAKRELEEELGYVGGELYPIGAGYANPAIQANKVHSFIAIGGACSQPQSLDAGETLHIEKYALQEFMNLILDQKSGVLYQSMHIGAIFFALNFIRQSQLETLQKFKALI